LSTNEHIYLDDLLEVVPCVVQGLHGEPGVGVRTHVEALDLAVEGRQLVEVLLGRLQRRLELLVVLTQVLQPNTITSKIAVHAFLYKFLKFLKHTVAKH